MGVAAHPPSNMPLTCAFPRLSLLVALPSCVLCWLCGLVVWGVVITVRVWWFYCYSLACLWVRWGLAVGCLRCGRRWLGV